MSALVGCHVIASLASSERPSLPVAVLTPAVTALAGPAGDTADAIASVQLGLLEVAEKRQAGDLKPFAETLQHSLDLIDTLRGHLGGITGLATGYAELPADLGVPTLDADGDISRFRNVEGLNTPELVDQVLAALDALDERNLGPSYVLAGLCSGAYWSFHAALRDERVSAAFMLNPQSLFWDPSLGTARVLRRGSRLKVLRGEVPPAQIATLVRGIPAMVARQARARWDARRAGGDELDRALDRLRDTDKHLRFMFSGHEPLYEELELEGRIQRMDRWPNVGFDLLPGQDHLLKPLEAQRFAHAALDRAVEEELQRAPESRSPDAQRAGSSVKPVPQSLGGR